MRKPVISILFAILSVLCSSQDITFKQFNVLFYGGLQLEHLKKYEQDQKTTGWSLNTGAEFMCFNWMSVGLRLNYGNVELGYESLKDIDMYTTPFLNLYVIRMFYLSGAYTYHRPIDQNFAYPYSHEEHIVSWGIGKKVFINKYLLLDIDARMYNARKFGLDSDGYPITKTTMGLSLDARLLIYFNAGGKNEELTK
jgi:hypothetical protein